MGSTEIDKEFQRLRRFAFPRKARAIANRYRLSEKGRARNRRYRLSKNGSAVLREAAYRFARSERGKLLYQWHAAYRRARKRTALVVGAEKFIKAIYDRANWLRAQGWPVEVDHIFPLGFGWHEPANLQIIFARENSSKNCNPDFEPSAIFA